MAQSSNTPYWNIFASELQAVLIEHGMDLGSLDDRVGLHRETVRRLKRSLYIPPSLPVLNPEDLNEVIARLKLRQEEIMRLRAAVLALSVQRMLSDRINGEEARLAAEQALPIILKALKTYSGRAGLGNTREGQTDPLLDRVVDIMMSKAIDHIDRGEQDEYSSLEARSLAEKDMYIHRAIVHCDDAINVLKHMNPELHVLPGWKFYYEKACHLRERLGGASC